MSSESDSSSRATRTALREIGRGVGDMNGGERGRGGKEPRQEKRKGGNVGESVLH